MAEGTGRTGLIVLGMHRSGTSLTAQLLGELGWSFGGEVLPSRGDNPSGYFEHAGVVAIHNEFLEACGRTWDDPRPMTAGDFSSPAAEDVRRRLWEVFARDFASSERWVLKDPRMCRLLPLWDGVLAESACEVSFVHVGRHPRAVAASLAKRDGMSRAWASLLWLRHTLEAERKTRGRRRAWMDFEELVKDPAGVLRRTFERLALAGLADLRAEVWERVVLPSEVHHRSVLDELHPWIDRTWRAVTTLEGGQDEAALAELDGVAAELSSAEGLLGGERDAAQVRYGELRLDRNNLAEQLEVAKRYAISLKEHIGAKEEQCEVSQRYASSLREALDAKEEELRQWRAAGATGSGSRE